MSFSYDIRDLYPDAEISGFDTSKENITAANELGIINSLLDIEKISDFKIIVVSVPVDTVSYTHLKLPTILLV